MKRPRRNRPPANGIALYWSKRERDHEAWHDKRPGDGHWLMWLISDGMRAVTTTEEERKRGVHLPSHEAGERFRAQCVARGFDPDTFRVVLRRPRNTGEVALTTIRPLCHPREQCERARARMVGPKRPGPAPLPKSEKREGVALVKVTPAERAELEAWAKREGRPLATLLREVGLRAARRLVRGGGR